MNEPPKFVLRGEPVMKTWRVVTRYPDRDRRPIFVTVSGTPFVGNAGELNFIHPESATIFAPGFWVSVDQLPGPDSEKTETKRK